MAPRFGSPPTNPTRDKLLGIVRRKLGEHGYDAEQADAKLAELMTTPLDIELDWSLLMSHAVMDPSSADASELSDIITTSRKAIQELRSVQMVGMQQVLLDTLVELYQDLIRAAQQEAAKPQSQ